jgi:hypothetical protein
MNLSKSNFRASALAGCILHFGSNAVISKKSVPLQKFYFE